MQPADADKARRRKALRAAAEDLEAHPHAELIRRLLLEDDARPGQSFEVEAACFRGESEDGEPLDLFEKLSILTPRSLPRAKRGHGHKAVRDRDRFAELLKRWGSLSIPPRWPRALLLLALVELTRDPRRLRSAKHLAEYFNRQRPPVPPMPEIGFEGDPEPGPLARISTRQAQRLIAMLRSLYETPPLSPVERWEAYVEEAEERGVRIEGPFRMPGSLDPNASQEPPILICELADGREYRFTSRRSERPGFTWEPVAPADPCPRCGSPVPIPKGKGRPRAYCSPRCASAERLSRHRSVKR